MIWLALCFVIIGYLGTMVVAWQSIARRNRITYLALGFILLGAVGALLITIDTSRTSNQLIRKSSQISDLNDQLLTKSNEIADLNRKIAHSNQVISEKSEEIAKLNQKIVDSVMGGDSFCYVYPMLRQGLARFILVHQGKYPLYDLAVRIVDLDKFDEFKKEGLTFENVFKAEINVNVGNLVPAQARLLNEVHINPKQILRFNIFFSARSGFFTEMLRIKKVGNEWKTAMKITRGTKDREITLLQKIDEGFPRGEGGVVQW